MIGIKRKASPFTILDNSLLRNKQLSFKARGILAHLLSHSSQWTIRMTELFKSAEGDVDGEATVRSGINELIEKGYMTRERVHGAGGKIAGWKYTVHEEPITTSRFSTSGFSTCGKSSAKNNKTKNNKLSEEQRVVSDETTPAADATGSVHGNPYGLNPGDLAEAQAQPEAEPEVMSLALKSDDEPDGKTFPWRQLMATVKRIVPQVVMPTAGARRDHAMKQFWRKHGKTVGCFELLAEKVAASDYLMARNGHTGKDGRPYSWGWIFSKSDKGSLRADEIMAGGYSTESMAWVLEKKATAASPKLTKVYLTGVSAPTEICLTEKLTGEFAHLDRYKKCDETKAGLPVYLDLSST